MSVSLRNSGTILIIGILLRYPMIIRPDRVHPEQLSAISGSGGAWAAVSLEQFASLPRDLRNSACTRHSLRHGKAISTANRQLHQTPPSLKTSPLSDLGSYCWGFTGSRRYQSISDSVLDACMLSQEQSSQLISGKYSFYLTNPNPKFCYKIGIFAWQFACLVVSEYLHRNRKYRDLGYYSGIRAIFLASGGLKKWDIDDSRGRPFCNL